MTTIESIERRMAIAPYLTGCLIAEDPLVTPQFFTIHSLQTVYNGCMRPKTDVIFYRDPDLKGIDLCRVENSDHCFPEHFHDDLYIISLITSGTCHCLGAGQKDSLTGPGGVTLLNPGQLHSGVPVDTGHLSYTICYITLEAMNSLVRELGMSPNTTPEFTAAILVDPLITALLENLFRTMIASRDSLEKEALILSAFHFILSRYGRQTPSDTSLKLRHPPVIRARDLLSRELDRKLSLEEVAQSVGLSRYHFLRTFKRETGLSPHQYRTLKRLETARALLGQGIPAVQVALETGFTDQSHFSNTFRRYFGTTPKQYLVRT